MKAASHQRNTIRTSRAHSEEALWLFQGEECLIDASSVDQNKQGLQSFQILRNATRELLWRTGLICLLDSERAPINIAAAQSTEVWFDTEHWG